WIMDEVQLMDAGLATTTQLQAFRRLLGTLKPARSLWMSATMRREWLHTIDVEDAHDCAGETQVSEHDRTNGPLARILSARKPLRKAAARLDDPEQLAAEVIAAHQDETLTLVVVNTIKRAMVLHDEIKKRTSAAELLLIHSRYRPGDRQAVVKKLLLPPGLSGRIAVTTQVIEAGVDISAATLFTEIAPWPSLVQRFGRCNRRGEQNYLATVHWIDLPMMEFEKPGKFSLPYSYSDLIEARNVLTDRDEVSPASLPPVESTRAGGAVIRLKDIIELFDTTPDLAGHDLDISHFIRAGADHDVQVFWRTFKDNPENQPPPHRDELCPVAIQDFRNLLKKRLKNVWRHDELTDGWVQVRAYDPLWPGLVLMLHSGEGCYDPARGFTEKSRQVVPIVSVESTRPEGGYDSDITARDTWQSISEHTDNVVAKISAMCAALDVPEAFSGVLKDAARWHDAGKAHPAFQAKIQPDALTSHPDMIVAKAPATAWRKDRIPQTAQADDDGRRRYFRHELASGLAALLNGAGDLTAYLAAAHHGKVRLSLRSVPGEQTPPNVETRFARGVWDGDVLPSTALGGGVVLPETTLTLEMMELGDNPHGDSWLARMLAFRDSQDFGPFRMGFLEALMKIADERASGGES
ncbi:CRISPR-associated helicase Cas3', partial [bacterium]|nr:CRISPR-associated helicase Cas3' [candidate division CSSED10-310 bacterium]